MAAIFDSLEDPKLIKLLKEGAVGVLPTDTVYGLVCVAENKESVKRLYGLKGRKPGTLIAASIEQLSRLGIKRSYVKAVEHFWPGAVSIVVPSGAPENAHLRQGKPDIAVRLPVHKQVVALLARVGPLLTTSANEPGKETANTIEEAEVYFGDRVDFYVDAGNLKDRKHSTIIRMVDDAVEVIREGAVNIDEKTGKIIP